MEEVKSSDFSDVFVSYRRKDVEFTKELVEELRKAGKEVWIDWEDIPPGSVGFSDDIKRGLEGADALIAILTPDYLESPYCVDMELMYAVELKKKLIPIVLKKFDGYDIPAEISHINWIYFTPHAGHENDFEESMPKVLQALDTDLEHVRTHKRLLLRALEWDNNERKSSYLLRGNALTEAEAWLAAAPDKIPDPTELHTQFIFESRKAAAEQQRRLLTAASVAAVLMAFLAVFAGFQWREADRQKGIAEANEQEALRQQGIAQNNAEESRSLALAANSQLNLNSNNLDLAVALALAGSEIEQAPQDTVLVLDEAAHLPGTQLVLTGHEDGVNTVAMHPILPQVLSGSIDTNIILWDIATGESLAELADHEAEILSITFSNSGNFAASTDASGTVIVWDLEAGEAVQTFAENESEAHDVFFASDDSSIIVGYGDGTVNRFDIESGDLIWQQTDHVNEVTALALSPDGTQFVASESGGNTENPTMLIVSDIETGEIIDSTEIGQDVNDIAYTTDGGSVLIALQRLIMQISLADFSTTQELEGHVSNIFSVTTSADGLFAVSASDDTFARLWSLADGTSIWSFSGHVRSVNDVVISPDGKTIVTASNDGTLRVWPTENSAIKTIMRDHASVVANADYGSSDSEGFTISWDAQVIRHDLETGDNILVFDGHEQPATGLDYDPNTGQVLSSSLTEMLLWDSETGEIIHRLDAFHEGEWITNVAITSDGTRAVTGDNSGNLGFWNLEDGSLINGLPDVVGRIRDVAINDDDTLVAVGTSDGQIVIFDMEGQEEVSRWTIDRSPIIWSIQFVPDSDMIAAALSSGNISLYDVTSSDLVRTLTGHAGAVNDLDLSDDGSVLLSGSEDLSLRLWDVETGLELRRLNLNDNVVSVVLNPDASEALVGLENSVSLVVEIGQQDKEVLIQWVKDNRYVAEFTCLQRQFYRLDASDCEVE